MFECPKCKKELEDMDVPEFYCKYCGNKILRDVLPSEGRNRRVINLSKEPVTSKQSDVQTFRNIQSTTSDVNVQNITHAKKFNLSIPLMLISSIGFIIYGAVLLNFITVVGIAFISIGVIGMFSTFFAAEKVASDKEEQKLEMIVDQIQIDIKNHDYISAKIKAATLHYGGGWSSEIEKKWKNSRELLLKHIDEAEKKDKS